MTPLSLRTQMVVAILFPQSAADAEQFLAEECGQNLPFCEKGTPESLERIRFAVLKIGNGDWTKFGQALDLAKRDWRDVLMWAEFANDLDAHQKWADQLLADR